MLNAGETRKPGKGMEDRNALTDSRTGPSEMLPKAVKEVKEWAVQKPFSLNKTKIGSSAQRPL